MSRPLALPFETWPLVDQRMWALLTTDGGPLDDRGVFAHLRETSRTFLCTRYARWLGWLDRDRPGALQAPPENRACPEMLQAWLDDDLVKLAPMSRLSYVHGLLQVLWAAAPDQDWTMQRRHLQVLRQAARHRHGSRKLGRVPSSVVLLEAGLNLATAKAERATTEFKRLVHCRDGAMMATLALIPMRKRAFAELALGRSVDRHPSGFVIRLSEDMTKNGRTWEAPVPDVLGPVLQRYTEEVRPRLLERAGKSHDAFWVTDRGNPFDPPSMRTRFVKITKEEIGIAIPPHFFRDAAATTLSRISPEHASLIRSLLGHASFVTAERHYIQAQGLEAGRDHAAVISDLKRTLPCKGLSSGRVREP